MVKRQWKSTLNPNGFDILYHLKASEVYLGYRLLVKGHWNFMRKGPTRKKRRCSQSKELAPASPTNKCGKARAAPLRCCIASISRPWRERTSQRCTAGFARYVMLSFTSTSTLFEACLDCLLLSFESPPREIQKQLASPSYVTQTIWSYSLPSTRVAAWSQTKCVNCR